MALEIERKFLLQSDAWRALTTGRVLLRQGYLSSTDQSSIRSSIRVRVAGEQAWLNLKARKSTRTRLEYEYPIPRPDAEEILANLCTGPLVEKYRHEIVAGPHVWEIDEFIGDNAGLIVAEIELRSEDDDFARPAWLGLEVTEDERYYNFNLAKQPFKDW